MDLKFAVPIRVGHIEFGKFGLDVAVLHNTSGQHNFITRFNIAHLIVANSIAIFGIITIGHVINCIAQSSTQVTQLHMLPNLTLPD